MKLRAVLVENEEHSLSRLKRLLAEFPQDIEVVGEAVTGPAAVETIRAAAPDVVFLDIDLPGFNGFRVLDELDRQPIVIFTTAFNQHALEAFKAHAVDYLLKPIETEAIAKALTKLRAMGCDHAQVDVQVARAVAEYLDAVGAGERTPIRIACREADPKKDGDRTVLVKLGEILYFQADHKYTAVHTANRYFLIDTPLIDLERKVAREFVRIHRSTLVNISWVSEIRRTYDGRMSVLLKDVKGTELPVSRHYAENLRNI